MSKNEENAVQEEEQTTSEQVVPETEAAEAAAVEEEVETAANTEEVSDGTSELETKLAESEKALTEKDKQYQYLAAEYDNFRRRSAKEKTDAYSSAKADAALAFLPVFDNLQRALAAPCTDAAYAKGVEMTMTQLRQVLEKLGITEIDALNQPFDPNLHNAVMHVDDDSVGESTVVEVFQSGFKMGDKVIRFAMVKVAN
ncbi:MAG: nucleotide exchange factor GrpE [Oscillospiraceae bacterium]|nr:nucleotide exchange factor GrpE [Eubacteriales bacterium]MDY2618727.1 nucleotide exchange factor GrpE [Oscillospiraceae bacterium]